MESFKSEGAKSNLKFVGVLAIASVVTLLMIFIFGSDSEEAKISEDVVEEIAKEEL